MSKFLDFNTTDTAYREVDGVTIDLSILTHQDIKPGRHPVIVRFHGGYLVSGSRLFPEIFPRWILDYAKQQSAIIITPDYRLLPESSGVDILDDLTALWHHVYTALPFSLAPLGLEADLTRILVIGDSAGGYLAVQSALLHGIGGLAKAGRKRGSNAKEPEQVDAAPGIRCVVAQYPMLDLEDKFYTEAYEKIIMGNAMVNENIPKEAIAKAREGNSKPKPVVSGTPPDRMDVARGAIQHGLYTQMLGDEDQLYPMRNLDHLQGGMFAVPMWLYHGKEDTAVPYEGTVAFAEKMQKAVPEAKVKVTTPNGEHMFDAESSLQTGWLREGLAWVSRIWL